MTLAVESPATFFPIFAPIATFLRVESAPDIPFFIARWSSCGATERPSYAFVLQSCDCTLTRVLEPIEVKIFSKTFVGLSQACALTGNKYVLV